MSPEHLPQLLSTSFLKTWSLSEPGVLVGLAGGEGAPGILLFLFPLRQGLEVHAAVSAPRAMGLRDQM